MRRWARIVVPVALALAAVATFRPREGNLVATRLPAIAAALREASPDAVLLAGNSHATLAAEAAPACAEWIDAGVPGATAHDYAARLSDLPSEANVRLAVLLIGTNDIRRAQQPLEAEALARFRADGERIVGWLRARARLVVVAAVPPIGEAATGKRDPAAVGAYSEALRDLCRDQGCRFADPFSGLRAGSGGLARPDALVDGIHLADYPALLGALDLCPPATDRESTRR
ncbi:MAG TPA: GDSL-type esterase/lipase family protein [Methylobacterium sp.]